PPMRSSSLPSRNCCPNFSRVRPDDSVSAVLPSITTPPEAPEADEDEADGEPDVCADPDGGSRISSNRSSAFSPALSAPSPAFLRGRYQSQSPPDRAPSIP